MANTNSKRLGKIYACPAIAAAMFVGHSADAELLFRDDFSQTDTTFNQNVQDNTSLSGSVVASMTQAAATYTTSGAIGGENGLATWRTGTPNSASFRPNYDFATNASLIAEGGFRVTLEGLTPPGGGNWASLMVFDGATLGSQNVTEGSLPLGVLLRGDGGSGGIQVFKSGTGSNPGTTTSNDPFDVAIEVTNISGFAAGQSFDYKILFDGTNVLDSGTITGVDTSTNFISVESWRGTSTVSAYSVEVIPEPSSLALLGLGGLLIARRRR